MRPSLPLVLGTKQWKTPLVNWGVTILLGQKRLVVVTAVTPAQRMRQEDPQGSLASNLAEPVSFGFSVRSCAKTIIWKENY